MKKFLMTLVLLVGIVAGLFAQKLTYQAVIRDNNQQLVVNTAVKATVTIDFAGDQADYTTTITDVSTNLHGLLTIEFGDGSLVGRDWTNATIAVKVVNAATPSIVYVNDEPRPVSAVPYALSVDGVAIQQYLTEHKYVTEMQVGNQIHDSISNVAGKFHTHDNMAILNATTATYTKADSLKLKGIADSAEVNVQSDWKQTDGSKDDYIKNKPSITDTVNGILSTGGYVTADALDSRHYLRSDSTVITTMQNDIVDLKAGQLDCDKVKECIKDTLSKYTPTADLTGLLQQLEARLDAQDAKMDSLAHLVDSLAKLVHGGDTVKFTCGTSKVKDVDGNEYSTVIIGKQCWMKENLKTTKKPNGDAIAEGVYVPNGDSSEVETYGRLYTWSVVMNGAGSTNYPDEGEKVQGICPEGWHVPSDAEWTRLTDYVNSEAEYRCGETDKAIANALSSSTGWNGPHDCNPGSDKPTRNLTGFSAVPAGRFYNKPCIFGEAAHFWSATQYGDNIAWDRYLFIFDPLVIRNHESKDNGSSVRCLRDAEVLAAMSVTTDSANIVTNNSATLHGNVTNMGEYSEVYAGFKYGTSVSTLTSIASDGSAMLGAGRFSYTVTGLTDGTQYYFKAFAANGADTVYGEVKNFTMGVIYDGQPCPGAEKVKDYDNNEYNTVKIGNQCWMKENLRTTKYADGTAIAKGTSTSTTKAYRYYPNNDSSKVSTYGYLYNWKAVMDTSSSSEADPSDVQGICPTGWHVPSDAEFGVLAYYVNGKTEYRCDGRDKAIANALSAAGWTGASNCNAGSDQPTRNKTGFSAVPAGRYLDGDFGGLGSDAYFWSATQCYGDDAWYPNLDSHVPGVFWFHGSKSYGLSVRCLKD